MQNNKQILDADKISRALQTALNAALQDSSGSQADYIPELSAVNPEITGIAVQTTDGQLFTAGECNFEFTLQSSAKMVVLAGLLEEFGPEQVLEWVRVEPSGTNFSAIARLDQFGPKPSNPCLNAGAITLCSHIPGDLVAKLSWLEKWCTKLFGTKLHLSPTVLASEKKTGDRNRSIAYLLQSNNLLASDVDESLNIYFASCSYEANLPQCAYFGGLLAAGGCNPDGEMILSHATTEFVISVMATCGLYNESGTHLLKTGLPAKSGVSGVIIAACPSVAGVAVFNPRLSPKGNSIRGEIMLQSLSRTLGLHFARPFYEHGCFKQE